MYRHLLIVIAAVLTACATTAGLEKSLNAWVGAEEANLIRAWGPPVESHEADGRKFITYVRERPTAAPIYRTAHTVGPAILSCTIIFETKDSKVVAWSHRGTDCVG